MKMELPWLSFRFLLIPLGLPFLVFLFEPAPAQPQVCAELCACTWQSDRYVSCDTTCTDSLEVTMEFWILEDCTVTGLASINRFHDGMFTNRPVSGTVDPDSVFLTVQIQAPQDPGNLVYNLEIANFITLSGVFGFLGDGPPDLPVTFDGFDLPVEPMTWGRIKARYSGDAGP